MLFMFAAPRLPVWMFTAVKPLLGGAIGSAVFQGSDYKLHTSSVFAGALHAWSPSQRRLYPAVLLYILM